MATSGPNRRHPMAVAMEWVARIMASAVMMILPGLAGQWVDRRLGTNWLVLIGFVLGITLSIRYLLAATRSSPHRSPVKGDTGRDDIGQDEPIQDDRKN